MKNFFLYTLLLFTLSVQAQPSYDFYDYTVSGTEYWQPASNPVSRMRGGTESIVRIQHSLTIPAGARLNIDEMHIEMGPQAIITIEAAADSTSAGGQLFVNASVLTAYRYLNDNSTDTATWLGITIEGNAAAGAGSLSMKSSIISYVGAGIKYNTITAGSSLKVGSDIPYNNQQALQVWPSPNNGAFTISMYAPENESVRITITDIAGRIVKEIMSAANKNIPVQIDALPGMYLITAAITTKKQSAKIVVK